MPGYIRAQLWLLCLAPYLLLASGSSGHLSAFRGPIEDCKENWFKQTLDHFYYSGRNGQDSYQQRYFTCDKFWKTRPGGRRGPIFFYGTHGNRSILPGGVDHPKNHQQSMQARSCVPHMQPCGNIAAAAYMPYLPIMPSRASADGLDTRLTINGTFTATWLVLRETNLHL